jgi:hypothetical protein
VADREGKVIWETNSMVRVPTIESPKLDEESLPHLVRIDALWRNDTTEGFGFNFVGEEVQFVSNVISDLYQCGGVDV